MNKPKLLITMGCSFTEGVGCYNLDKLSKSTNYFELPESEQHIHRESFHKLGWPNRLGKKLGYDKVINLGLGGSSTSGQVKQFFEKYIDIDFSEYEVLIVWLLTEPSRISFYKDGEICDYSIGGNNSLHLEYTKLISNKNELIRDLNLLLEHIFYIKIIENVCESKGYSLLLTPLYHPELFTTLRSLHKSKYYLTPYSKSFVDSILRSSRYSCNIPNGDAHLTPEGYEVLASDMYNEIKLHHPHLLSNPKDEIDWIYDGDYISHIPKIKSWH
jgi:hypothetical protein